LLAFVAVATADVRSFWIFDVFYLKGIGFQLNYGRAQYEQWSGLPDSEGFIHETGAAIKYSTWDPLKFSVFKEVLQSRVGAPIIVFDAIIPLWFPLLLLLIVPVRWLIARPANAPAFRVITDAKQEPA